MKKAITILILFITFSLSAQNYTPIINYHFNGTPKNGIKIKTNIPFQHGYGMPTLIIEGYGYGSKSPIGLILNWYVYSGNFISSSIASFGNYTPEIKLYNENGKIVIFVNDKKYYNRFTIRGFAQGIAEKTTDFEGWTIVDELPTGTNAATMTYKNKFAGNVTLPDGIWNKNGNVGIGNISPDAKLAVRTSGALIARFESLTASNKTKGVRFNSKNSKGSLHYLDIAVDAENDKAGFGLGTTSSNLPLGKTDLTNAQIVIDRNGGKVGIGTPNPDAKLTVKGNIHTQEVKVDLNGAVAPDYVFLKDYDLKTLKEVLKHIKKEGHLPNIPSAKEMEKNGVELKIMSLKLLEKIEELTLYAIQQQKEIEKEQEKNKNLENRLTTLEKLILTKSE